MNENRFEKGEITQKCRSNMEKLTLLYISLSGNTKNFIDRISKPLSSEYDLKIIMTLIQKPSFSYQHI